MPAWSYDSYCNDSVQSCIDEYNQDFEQNLEKIIIESLEDYPGEYDIEFILGIGIYGIRTGCKLQNKYLYKLRDLIDYLLEEGKFKFWEDVEKRRQKIVYERKLINNILKGKQLKFGKLKEKTSNFKNLNTLY